MIPCQGQILNLNTQTSPFDPLPSQALLNISTGLSNGDYFAVRYINASLIPNDLENYSDINFVFDTYQYTLNVHSTVEQTEGFTHLMATGSEGYGGFVYHDTNKGVRGLIHNTYGIWEIFSISPLTVVVIQKNKNLTGSVPGDDTPDDSNEESPSEGCIEKGNCGSIVDILLVVPPDTEQWLEDDWGIIRGSFWASLYYWFLPMTVNLALVNSDIQGPMLRSQVYYDDFDYKNTSIGNVDVDNVTLANDYLAVRNLHRADMVVLVSSIDYFDGSSNINGKANTIGPIDKSAFIVESQHASVPSFVFAHEYGHITGARHNNCANDLLGSPACDNTATVCTHAWRFAPEGPECKTILALAHTNSTERVLHYSNPEVDFNGFVTGRELANNSLALSNGGCALALNNISPEFDLDINTDLFICWDEHPMTVEACAIEAAPNFYGHPPYNFTWSVTCSSSNTCSSYIDFIQQTPTCETASIEFLCNFGCDIEVEVTVTTADGVTMTKSVPIKVKPSPCDHNRSGNVDTEIIADKEYLLTPNPSSGLFFVSGLKTELLSIDIRNIYGKVVYKLSGAIRSDLDLGFLNDGLYFIEFNGLRRSLGTQKIIIQK